MATNDSTNLSINKLMIKAKNEIKKIGLFDDIFGQGKIKRYIKACRYYIKISYLYEKNKDYSNAADILFNFANKIKNLNLDHYRHNLYKSAFDYYDIYLDMISGANLILLVLNKIKICTDELQNIYRNESNFFAAGISCENFGYVLEKNRYANLALIKYKEANSYYCKMAPRENEFPAIRCTTRIINILGHLQKFKLALEYLYKITPLCIAEDFSKRKISELIMDTTICVILISEPCKLPKFINIHEKNILSLVKAANEKNYLKILSLSQLFPENSWQRKSLTNYSNKLID